MGLATWLGFRPRPIPGPEVTAAPIVEVLLDQIRGQSHETLWREQPHLRTVVGFISRNIAQLGIHAFTFAEDGGRQRERGSTIARLLAKPNGQMTGYELVESLVADLALYDIAYWAVMQDDRRPDKLGWVIRPIPPRWVEGTWGASTFGFSGYIVNPPNGTGRKLRIDAEDMVVFHGYNPSDPRIGASRVEALKSVLAEQIHAQVYRDQNWRRGGRVSTVLSRPADAPEWSKESRTRFQRAWSDKYAGDEAPEAGGTPILEDGMKLERLGFSAKEDQYVETNKLSLATVAQVYHVNPTMVGQLDDANYSNVREFRRMLYGDTLGPLIEMIQQRINAFVLPHVGAEPGEYVEFNTKAKLQGNFEEQGEILQTAVGGPWMTVNEARDRENMTHVDGGDEVIRPLNVTAPGDHKPIEAEPASEGSEGPK